MNFLMKLTLIFTINSVNVSLKMQNKSFALNRKRTSMSRFKKKKYFHWKKENMLFLLSKTLEIEKEHNFWNFLQDSVTRASCSL